MFPNPSVTWLQSAGLTPNVWLDLLSLSAEGYLVLNLTPLWQVAAIIVLSLFCLKCFLKFSFFFFLINRHFFSQFWRLEVKAPDTSPLGVWWERASSGLIDGCLSTASSVTEGARALPGPFDKCPNLIQGGRAVKNPPANAGDAGSIPGSGKSPGEEMAACSSSLAGHSTQGHEESDTSKHKHRHTPIHEGSTLMT